MYVGLSVCLLVCLTASLLPARPPVCTRVGMYNIHNIYIYIHTQITHRYGDRSLHCPSQSRYSVCPTSSFYLSIHLNIELFYLSRSHNSAQRIRANTQLQRKKDNYMREFARRAKKTEKRNKTLRLVVLARSSRVSNLQTLSPLALSPKPSAKTGF